MELVMDSGSGDRRATTNTHALIDERRALVQIVGEESPWGRNDEADRRADNERRSGIWADVAEIDSELEFREDKG
jgi:hypothetical protein